MKRLLLLWALVGCALLLPGPAAAEFPSASMEQRFTYSGNKTSDALILTGPGFLHAVTCSSDAAATAGSLDIRDGVAAGGGTVIHTITFVAAYFPPVTMIYNVKVTNGIYLDFTTTADVSCSVSYR